VSEHVRRIAAITAHASRTLDVLARKRIAVTTRYTVAAVAGEPTDAHARAGVPAVDIRARGLQCANHFVTWNPRVLEPGHLPLYRQCIAVTNTARMNTDAYLVRPWLRDIALFQPELRIPSGNDHCAHFCHASLRVFHLAAPRQCALRLVFNVMASRMSKLRLGRTLFVQPVRFKKRFL
jgi:hypothetical protein